MFMQRKEYIYMGQAIAIRDSGEKLFYYIDTNCNRLSTNNYQIANDFNGNYACVVLENSQSRFDCCIIDRSFQTVFGPARIIYNNESCLISATLDSNQHVKGFKYYNLKSNRTCTFDDYFVKIWKNKFIILQSGKTNLYSIYSLLKNEVVANNLDTIRCDYTVRQKYETNELFFSQSGKEGVMDSTGEIIIRPNYDYIFLLNQTMFIVLKNGNFRIIQKTILLS